MPPKGVSDARHKLSRSGAFAQRAMAARGADWISCGSKDRWGGHRAGHHRTRSAGGGPGGHLSAIKIVPQGYEFTVERFGRYTRTLKPGITILTPFVEAHRPARST